MKLKTEIFHFNMFFNYLIAALASCATPPQEGASSEGGKQRIKKPKLILHIISYLTLYVCFN